MLQLNLFEETASEVLPTNLTTDKHPVHRWYNFIAGYSPEYVLKCCSHAGVDERSRILDPFAGCGTTLVTANFLGVESVGYEAHPFFHEIALAKTRITFNPHLVEEFAESILEACDSSESRLDLLSEDARTFLLKLFPTVEILRRLVNASLLYDSLPSEQRPFFMLMLSKVVDLVCHSQTDGIYKAPTSKKRGLPIEQAVTKVSHEIGVDLLQVRNLPNKAAVHLGSSENMIQLPNETVDLCVTSPPYLNNFDFAEMTRMHLYFWRCASSWSEISNKVRNKLIVNTTTALKGHREKQAQYRAMLPESITPQLDQLVTELDALRKIKPSHKPYHQLIYPYFAQIKSVLSETFRVLKPGGRIHLVVANAALYGVHIPTDALLASVMEVVGFRSVSISQFRSRGDRWKLSKRQGSEQGLGEYEIIAERH